MRLGKRRYRNQLVETGHQQRDGDIARLARLGIAATRYPVLWETTAPHDPSRPELGWARRRLESLRALGVEPIVTLVHHGGGPVATTLLDREFATGLARYAGAVAAAFPWIERWTPVNEPLTTARFSTLYGTWYPKLVDDHRAFGRALAHQVLAIEMAMEAIRRSVPRARLVMTEDLQGFTALDDSVAGYVEHKRERAFLSIELLQGRVVTGHPLYRYLREACGLPRAILAEIAARATPPDLVGWNYYPYSERTLASGRGGVARNLATVETGPHPISPRPLLRAAHARLGLPFGLAEVHVDAKAAQRVRWLLQRRDDLVALAAEGLPVRMLGAWAAFGMCDWNALLVRRAGHAEDGVFTFGGSGRVPRTTAVATALRALARGETVAMPARQGWWERTDWSPAVSGATRRSPATSARPAAGTSTAVPGGTSSVR